MNLCMSIMVCLIILCDLDDPNGAAVVRLPYVLRIPGSNLGRSKCLCDEHGHLFPRMFICIISMYLQTKSIYVVYQLSGVHDTSLVA